MLVGLRNIGFHEQFRLGSRERFRAIGWGSRRPLPMGGIPDDDVGFLRHKYENNRTSLTSKAHHNRCHNQRYQQWRHRDRLDMLVASMLNFNI